MKFRKIRLYAIVFTAVFFVGCSLDDNIVVKNEQDNYVVIGYGKSIKHAEKSAYASMSKKCGDNARVKSINTEYVGALGETENKITTQVMEMVEQLSYAKGFNLPIKVDNDENYRTELIFSCK